MRSEGELLAVDTNILVRLIANDDASQGARSVALVRRKRIWISKTVLLETEWVLRSLYKVSPASVSVAFRRVAGLPGASLEESDAVAQALDWLDRGFDFADALHMASMGPADRFATFDEELARRAKRLQAADVLIA